MTVEVLRVFFFSTRPQLFFFFSLSLFPIFSRPPLTLRALLAGHLVVDDVLGPLDCLFFVFRFHVWWTRRRVFFFQDFVVDERPQGERAKRETKILAKNDRTFLSFSFWFFLGGAAASCIVRTVSVAAALGGERVWS